MFFDENRTRPFKNVQRVSVVRNINLCLVSTIVSTIKILVASKLVEILTGKHNTTRDINRRMCTCVQTMMIQDVHSRLQKMKRNLKCY